MSTLRHDYYNLKQFGDFRKPSPDWCKWVYLIPGDGVTHWLATDSHNVGCMETEAVLGLITPRAITEGDELLKLLHKQPDATFRFTNHLIVEWELKIQPESIELESGDQHKPEPYYEKQSASFEAVTGAIPSPLTWLEHYEAMAPRRLLRLGVTAKELKILGMLKEGKNLSSPPPAILQLTSKGTAVTVKLPNSPANFRAALTTNSLHTEMESP